MFARSLDLLIAKEQASSIWQARNLRPFARGSAQASNQLVDGRLLGPWNGTELHVHRVGPGPARWPSGATHGSDQMVLDSLQSHLGIDPGWAIRRRDVVVDPVEDRHRNLVGDSSHSPYDGTNSEVKPRSETDNTFQMPGKSRGV